MIRTVLDRVKWTLVEALVAVKDLLVKVGLGGERTGYVFLLPSLLSVSALLITIGILAWYSFLTFDPFHFVVYNFTLENWLRVTGSTFFWKIFPQTLGYSALVCAASLILGFPYAYCVVRVRSSLAKKLLIALILFPFTTGIIIQAYGWLIVLGKRGLVQSLLGYVGLGGIHLMYSPVSVFLGLLQIMLPFAVLMLVPAISSIDRELEMAAQNLGADKWRTFRHVIIPLSFPGIAAAVIIVFTLCISAYAVPEILGGGRVDFAANKIFTTLFNVGNYPFTGVLSLVLIAVNSLIVIGIFRFIGAGTLSLRRRQDR